MKLWIPISLLCSFLFVFGEAFESLALIKTNDGFKFAPIKFEGKELYYDDNQIYHFCPDSKSNNEISLYLKEISGKTKAKEIICAKPLEAVTMKVQNANQLRPNFNNDLEWYVRGFKISKKKLNGDPFDVNPPSGNDDSKRMKYEQLDERFEIVQGLSIFYDKKSKQTVAVQYELRSSNSYPDYDDPLAVMKGYEQVKSLDLAGIDECVQKLGCHVPPTEEMKPLDNPNSVKPVPMARPRQFVILFHQNLARVNANLTLVWNDLRFSLKAMDNFLEKVAMKIGNLKITTGITGADPSTHNSKGTDLPEGHKEEGEKNYKFVIPQFIWKAVEYTKDNQNYGIILVLPNSITKIYEKICAEDVCQNNKWLIKDDENKIVNTIYCCKMTQYSIQNLKVDFLELKEATEFNLGLFDKSFFEKPASQSFSGKLAGLWKKFISMLKSQK